MQSHKFPVGISEHVKVNAIELVDLASLPRRQLGKELLGPVLAVGLFVGFGCQVLRWEEVGQVVE